MIYSTEEIAKRIEELGEEVMSLKDDLKYSYQQGRADAIEEFVKKITLVKLTYPHNNAPSKDAERQLLQTIEEQIIKIANMVAEKMKKESEETEC